MWLLHLTIVISNQRIYLNAYINNIYESKNRVSKEIHVFIYEKKVRNCASKCPQKRVFDLKTFLNNAKLFAEGTCVFNYA